MLDEAAAADSDDGVGAAADGVGEDDGGAGGEEDDGTAELALEPGALLELDPPGLDDPTFASFRWN